MKQFGSYQILSPKDANGYSCRYVAQRPGEAKVVLFLMADWLAHGEQIAREFFPYPCAPHPNVATIYERGEIDGALFFTEELVEGPSIRELLSKEKTKIPPAIALFITAQICAGLTHLTSTLDEKALRQWLLMPSSVILSNVGEVKLSRSSILSWGDTEISFFGEGPPRLGLRRYLSPGEVHGEKRDSLFIAGVLLYEMLSLCSPFSECHSDVEIIQSLRERRFPSIEEHEPSLPKEICRIVNYAMCGERYANPSELEQELWDYLQKYQ